MAKNPEMAKSTAFAVATQQSHALGKTPKTYGTPEGKAKAKQKYKTPGDDKKTASVGAVLEFARKNPALAAGAGGAVIGAATADKDHRLEGAAMGGAMGAGAGHLIGGGRSAAKSVSKGRVLGPGGAAPKLLAEAPHPKVEITNLGPNYGKPKPKLLGPKVEDVADAEFEEVKKIASRLLTPLEYELEKQALSLAGIRGGIANATAKVAPSLNKPVMQAAQQGAHALQKSPNSFVQGVGNTLAHKAHSPGRLALGVANPIGTAAEALTSGAGTAASKGLSAAGGKLQAAHGPADAVVREGRAMTPVGRLRNAAGDLGGKVQQSFQQGGTGHKVLTKHLPLAAEIGGAAAVGTALHIPTGLAGLAGKGAVAAAGHAAPALGAALNHAPAAIQHGAGAIGGAAKAIGGAAKGFVAHAAEDALGTGKQNMLASGARKMFGGAAKAVGHTLAPAAHAAAGHAMPAIPRAAGLPSFG